MTESTAAGKSNSRYKEAKAGSLGVFGKFWLRWSQTCGHQFRKACC